MSRRVEVRDSGVHGRGVFALADLPRGEHIGWYAGEVISAEEADRRYGDSDRPDHTMYFARSDGRVIDGSTGGNETSFLNHGCAPNCEAEEYDDHEVAIVTRRAVRTGDELFIDYRLQLDGEVDYETRALYACHCGGRRCRGTMLAE